MQVAGFHFHWLRFKILITDARLHAIHSQSETLDPVEFSRRTVAALNEGSGRHLAAFCSTAKQHFPHARLGGKRWDSRAVKYEIALLEDK